MELLLNNTHKVKANVAAVDEDQVPLSGGSRSSMLTGSTSHIDAVTVALVSMPIAVVMVMVILAWWGAFRREQACLLTTRCYHAGHPFASCRLPRPLRCVVSLRGERRVAWLIDVGHAIDWEVI